MAVSSVLTKMIGQSSEPLVIEVEKGQIRRFAQAIGETNPIHYDENAAKAAGFPGIISSCTYASAIHCFDDFYDEVGINPHAVMHQEEEYEYFKPIFAGDILSVVHTVSNVYDKQVPNGQLVFIVIESRGNDKRGKSVFKSRRVLVELRK